MTSDRVYLVQHTIEDRDETSKIIGIYRTSDEAKFAIRRAITKPGFSDHPSGFCVDEYEVNKDHWIDGFGDAWLED